MKGCESMSNRSNEMQSHRTAILLRRHQIVQRRVICIEWSSSYKWLQPMRVCESTSNRCQQIQNDRTAILSSSHQMSQMQATRIYKGAPINHFIRRSNPETTLQMSEIDCWKLMAKLQYPLNNSCSSTKHCRALKCISVVISYALHSREVLSTDCAISPIFKFYCDNFSQWWF
jgi:hypothetical protein